MGHALRTATRSPGLKLGCTVSFTTLHFLHLAAELFGRDHAALDHRLRDRGHPALVVAHLLVRFRWDRLDVLAQLVDRHPLLAAVNARKQDHQRIDPALPVDIVVLGALDQTGGHSTHVVMTALDHAIHSLTGARASCSGWQSMSTSDGPPCARAASSPPARSPGSITRHALTPS